MTGRIITVTANAAIDKRLSVPAITPGTVMRITSAEYSAGGKGLNVARVAGQLGADVLATGFLAGHAGSFIAEQLDRQGIAHDFVAVDGESRSCLNLIDDSGQSTEFLEPGPVINQAAIDQLEQKLVDLTGPNTAVVFSGSLPQGCPIDTYARLVTSVHNAGGIAVVDTSGEALLAALEAHPDVIKPNRDEGSALTGAPVLTARTAAQAAIELGRAYSVSTVAISLGAEGAVAADSTGVWWVEPPAITPVNPVGCGDGFVAALVAAHLAGQNTTQTLINAVEVATACALSAPTGSFEPTDRDLVRNTGVVVHDLTSITDERITSC
jgi:tagatose 6-phosphate kinase